ncbi:MAG: DUF6125 family protein [Candidatus Hodarchaeota archaeon]
MRKVSKDDKLFYFERNFFTLDGLWIIETENETDLETSLKIDLAVWKRYFQIAYKRIKKYLKKSTTNVDDIIDILSFRWSCEGWEYEIVKSEPKQGNVLIKKCPYHDIMTRNENRHNAIPRICTDICNPLYETAIKSLNSEIALKRSKRMGTGDGTCDFQFSL